MQEKLLAMPNDDELFHTLVDAANDGAHENIKKVIKQITGYVEKAKGEIKRLVNFNPEQGLSLNLSVPVGDAALAAFIDVQNLLVKGLAKALMFSVGASTFGSFLRKMKERPDDSKEITIATTTRVLTMFFQKLGEKYVINETPEHIREVVVGLFDQV
ncbi:MAG: hypothetical protein LBD75_06345 [Candidatus Peribacteria bacterium]|jgi:hypothetical protein|nr:hypothetical protein [Candidatus Peribacteria bacterium]